MSTICNHNTSRFSRCTPWEVLANVVLANAIMTFSVTYDTEVGQWQNQIEHCDPWNSIATNLISTFDNDLIGIVFLRHLHIEASFSTIAVHVVCPNAVTSVGWL
jgi:DUF2075 family protein